MSRKVTGAFAVMLGCGVALLGLLPKAPGRYARRTTLERSATRPGVVDAGLEARVREALRSAPLAFEANLGQTDEQVKFTAGGAGYTLFLTGEEAVIALHRPFAREKKPVYLEERAQGWHAGEPMSAVLRLKFIGASATTRLTGIDEQPARTNYFIGNDESRWRRNVPNYREVRYENLYPGVDAVFYGDRRTLEYDFVVKPGADPRVITLGFEGARNLKLSPAGELAAETPLGEVRLLQPRVYQETISGARVPVAGKYVQRGEGLIGFELAGYDAGRAVVIDPPVSVMPRMLASPPPPPGPPTPTGSALQLGTYLGGQFDEAINAIAVGSNGQVYVAGFSDSFSGFPAAGTPFQGFNAGAFDCSQFPQHPCGDAFVATLNTTTGALVATTFLGGGADDVAWGLALDSANDPYVVGESDSGNFPTTAATAFQATPGNASCASGSRTRPCRHAFFSKLTPNLSSLTYSTFLAGTDDDSAFAVAVDPSGNAFITGVAGFGFTTVTPASGAYSGAGDAFVARVDPTASGTGSLIYATYIGGSGTDEGLAIAVDVNGNASIGGATFSTVNTSVAFPTTINAVQAGSSDASFCGPGGGFNCGDGFIAQVDATGTLTYASFFGGDSTDQVNGIALDAAGNIFVTGATSSHSIPIPTTPGAFDTAGSSGFDAFAAKINPAAAGLAGVTYSTFLAGSNDDSGNAIAIDPSGNAFIAGTTNSTDYPTFLALQAASRVGFFSQTSFVTSLNAAGSALNFSTYYGGTNTETGRAVAIDAAGLIYAGGSTNSTDLCTAKAFQPQNNSQFGTADAFLTIINPTNTAAVCVMMTNGTMPPGPVDFGQVDVGTTSFPQTVDLFNAGSAAMTFTTPIAGPNAADFKETDTCAGTVAGGTPSGPCSLSITFKPTAAGGTTETATMTITTTGLVPTTVINLTGVALGPPPATLTPNPVTFLPEVVGTTEAPLTVTLANTGVFGVNSALTVTNIALGGTNPGDFALSPLINFSAGNPCFFFVPVTFPITVFPGSSCVFNVTFTPTAQNPTPRTATLTVTDNGTTTTQTININGPTAAGNGPNIALSGPLSFGPVIQNTPSASQVLTITNSGGANMTVSSVVVTAGASDYAAPTTCSPSVPLVPGGTCTVTVTFTPTALGSRPGTLTITDTAPASPHLVSLTGTGTPPNSPGITLSSTVNFGQQVLNTTSLAQTVTITSSGAAALTITSVTSGGDYASASTCPISPATLAVGTSCTVTVTFTPTGLGARIAALTINDTAPGSPHMISLTGTGINNGGPGISLSSPLSFGPVLQNTASPAQAVALTNNGVAALIITSIVAGGDYAQANNCPGSVVVGGSCTINVTFTPTALGARPGTVTITDNAPGSPHVISLTGVGTSPGGGPTVSLGSALFFGPVLLNSASASQSASLTNTGGAPLTVTGIAASGDFAATNNCGASVGIGATCTITVTFTPTVLGPRVGTLTISDNAPNNPQTVGLTGTGVTFTIAPASGSGLNVTVVPGQTAQYSLTLVPSAGFVGTVNLTCGGNPPTTICTVTPSSVTLGGGTPVTVLVSVRTNCITTLLPPRGPISLPPGLPPQIVALWLLSLLALGLVKRYAQESRIARLAPALVLLLLVVTWAGCGSGSSVINVPGAPTTPAGIYNINVIGTSGAQSQQIVVTLRVT